VQSTAAEPHKIQTSAHDFAAYTAGRRSISDVARSRDPDTAGVGRAEAAKSAPALRLNGHTKISAEIAGNR